MPKKSIIFIFIILGFTYLLAASPAKCESQLSGITSFEPFTKKDRILILSPHPDDETIGCAGIIQAALKAGADIHIVYLTNGEHNEFAFIVYEKRIPLIRSEFVYLGKVRKREAIKAMKLLGLDESRLEFLGYPDFGTFIIFKDFWRSRSSFKSLLTWISRVPYQDNFSYGAAYKAENILADLKFMLLKYQPTKIFVSHPADTNPDHKALYLFLQIALADLEKDLPQPKIYPYLIHCVGWPLPRHYHPELSLFPPQKFFALQIPWLKYELDQDALEKKHRAILTQRSQTQSSAFYLLSFARKNELFGDYPEIELTRQYSFQEAPPPKGGAFSPFFTDLYTDSSIDRISGLNNEKSRLGFAVVDNHFVLRIYQPDQSVRRFKVTAYLFGYSHKKAFKEMPKIRILARNSGVRVFDGRKIVKPKGVSAELKHPELILKIPLALLGSPDFILISLIAHTEREPLDSAGFHKIKIRRESNAGIKIN